MSRLLMYSEAWGKGGIESFTKNVLPALANYGYKIDLFSTWDWEEQDDSWLEELNFSRFVAFRGYKPNQLKRLVCAPKIFRSLLRNGNYDAVWINTMNGMGFRYAYEAKIERVPVRIVHSHNSDVGNGAKHLKRFVGKMGTEILGKYSTVNVACSKKAGKYLFNNQPFSIIQNGIDVERFRFNDAKRIAIRKELGIDSKTTLIGNIGRINHQKNPLFQIRVFSEYKKLCQNACYLMLGQPDEAAKVAKLASHLGVIDSLIIHNPVIDAAPFYSALDGFLMPSLYEGLGFAQIEAQCASLPILCSDILSEEADITELIKKCALNDTPSEWAKKLYELVNAYDGRRKKAFADQVAEAGFSIDSCVDQVLCLLRGEHV